MQIYAAGIELELKMKLKIGTFACLESPLSHIKKAVINNVQKLKY